MSASNSNFSLNLASELCFTIRRMENGYEILKSQQCLIVSLYEPGRDKFFFCNFQSANVNVNIKTGKRDSTERIINKICFLSRVKVGVGCLTLKLSSTTDIGVKYSLACDYSYKRGKNSLRIYHHIRRSHRKVPQLVVFESTPD